MFSRVIIATDLSPASTSVVQCAGRLRAFGAKECLLLQCLSVQEAASTAFSYRTDALESELREQTAILEQQGYKVEARVVPGFAKYEISRIATEENYALIVIGSRGQSLASETLLGSVAHGVILNAVKPVLLIPVKLTTENGEACVQTGRCDFSEHILFATDFSENADHAFTYVEKLVSDGARHVTLVHVQDKARLDPHLMHRLDEFNKIDMARLEELKQALQTKGPAAIDIELPFGSPFVEIVRLINERSAHLVVMGSQGRGFIEELFLGSVSHNVARHSDAAVLLVPAKRSAEEL